MSSTRHGASSKRGGGGWSSHHDEDDERPLAKSSSSLQGGGYEGRQPHWRQSADPKAHSGGGGWGNGTEGYDGAPPLAKARRRHEGDGPTVLPPPRAVGMRSPDSHPAARSGGVSDGTPSSGVRGPVTVVRGLGTASTGFSDEPGVQPTAAQQLFEPAARPPGPTPASDKRLEKAVSALTLPMLEAVRLSRKKLLYLIEHPKSDEFIWGAYVRYPDLEQIEGHRRHPVDVHQFRPAQITKVVRQSEPSEVMGVKIPFELIILQYTVRDDGSLKVRKAKMGVQYVAEDPFTPEELEIWKQALKLFDGRAGAEKLHTLPTMLLSAAEKLKNFTFTDADIDAIIARKSAGTALDLNLRCAELELQVQQLKKQIEDQANDGDYDDESTEEDLEAKLETAEAELAEVIKQIKQKGGIVKTVGTVGGPSAQPALMINLPVKAKTGLSDWKTLDIAVHISRLSWMTGPHQLDANSNLTQEWWKRTRHAWRARIRSPQHEKDLRNALQLLGIPERVAVQPHEHRVSKETSLPQDGHPDETALASPPKTTIPSFQPAG